MRVFASILLAVLTVVQLASAVHGDATTGTIRHPPSRRLTYRHPGPNASLPPENDGQGFAIRQAGGSTVTPDQRLVIRQAGGSTVPSPASGSAASAWAVPTSSLPKAPSTPPASPPSPRPTPMDLQLSYALSEPCLRYLSTLLSSSTFTTCLPFSLLLTTSTSFGSFLTSSAPTYDSLNSLLAYVSSPRPDGGTCDAFFVSAAQTIMDKDKCRADVNGKVPSAISASRGLGNAPVMREAAGLVDPDTGVYCYIEAKASGRPDDLYLWSIPAGINLPASSTPTCSKCSSLLLGLYAQKSDKYASLNSTIINRAIGTVNNACGSGFVQYYSYSAAANAASSTHSHLHLSGASLPVIASLAMVIMTLWAYLA